MKNRGQYSHKGVRAKKNLGQHFLKDPQIARKISDTLVKSPVKNILEIGPGTGILTQNLLSRDIQLRVMELDRDSVRYLREDFTAEHPHLADCSFEIIEADFLKYDLGELFSGKEFGIIGNFPYNISSQILFKTLENRGRIPFFSGMFQKEVAKRICEGPGSKTYGILSVLTQAFYRASYLFDVPPQVFLPPPKVDSGVLELIRKENYLLPCDENLFKRIVKQAFQQRRKTLRNSLKSFTLSPKLRELPVFTKRPEQLSPKEFIELTQHIQEQ